MDFVSDQLFAGTMLRILTIIDVFTRLSPTIDARKNYTDDAVHLLGARDQDLRRAHGEIRGTMVWSP